MKNFFKDDIPEYFYIIVFLLYSFNLFTKFYIPHDDALRHAVTYFYEYNLKSHTFGSYYPSFDPHYLYDIVFGFFHSKFGIWSFPIMQSLLLLLYSLAYWRLGSMYIEDKGHRLLFYSICIMFSDYILARPKSIANSLFLLSFGFPTLSPIFSLLCVSFYHAFWIYLSIISIYFVLKRRYLLSFLHVAIAVLGVFLWSYLTSYEYIEFEYTLFKIDSFRIAEFVIDENKSLLVSVLPCFVFIYPSLRYFYKDIPLFVSILPFMVINQSRYIASVIPLSLCFFRYIKISIPATICILSILLPLSKLETSYDFFSFMYNQKHINLSGNVLCQNLSGANYALYFAQTRDVRIAPIAEVGFMDRNLQKTVVYLNTKNPCGTLRKYNVNYLITDGSVYKWKCLEREINVGKYTIMKVIND